VGVLAPNIKQFRCTRVFSPSFGVDMCDWARVYRKASCLPWGALCPGGVIRVALFCDTPASLYVGPLIRGFPSFGVFFTIWCFSGAPPRFAVTSLMYSAVAQIFRGGVCSPLVLTTGGVHTGGASGRGLLGYRAP